MDSWQAWLSLIMSSFLALFVWYMQYSQVRRDKEKEEFKSRLREAENRILVLETMVVSYKEQLAAVPKRATD